MPPSNLPRRRPYPSSTPSSSRTGLTYPQQQLSLSDAFPNGANTSNRLPPRLDSVELIHSPTHRSATFPPPQPPPLPLADSGGDDDDDDDDADDSGYSQLLPAASSGTITTSHDLLPPHDDVDTDPPPHASRAAAMSQSPLIRSPPDQQGPYESVSQSRTSIDLTQSTGDLSTTSQGRRSLRARRSSLSKHSDGFTSGVEIAAGPGKLPEGFIAVDEEGEEEDGAEGNENCGTDEEADIEADAEGGYKYSDEDPPDNSIYPQVRASVSAVDDHTLSISTPRMWILSMIFALLGSATNLFFSLRYPSVYITPVIALILVHPIGLAWDSIFKRESDPEVLFENGVRVSSHEYPRGIVSRRTRVRLWLAQGHWNEKEHACVYISSNVAFGFAFATDVIVEQRMFYKQGVTVMYQLLLTISTQILGYAFAGITRRYLVRPPAMIWPGTLMSTAMFTTMHRSENKVANGWKVTRWRFFVYVWLGAFTWYFVPGLLMPALSYFNVLTWFAPDNVVVANLFGVSSGLGMFPITFDWAQIAYIGSPLLTPWWAAANVVAGLAIVMWIIAPLCYYSNTLFSAYMPILSSSVFDNTGKIYDVSKILTPEFLFDEEAFKRYSPIYMPITYALSYGVQFAALAALVTHTVCWHGRDIARQTTESFSEKREGSGGYQPLGGTDSRGSLRDQPVSSNSSRTDPGFEASMGGGDVHNRLMKRYDDAPLAWYLAIFVAMLAVGIFVVEYYPVHLPYYGLLLALGITTVMFLPVAIIMAITNQHSSLYLISQIICGYVFPGRPVANMVFTTYAYISSAQGIKFSSDLKLGHYMKIPPRILFAVQIFATLLASFTQIGVLNWMFAQIPGICTPEALNGFNCPLARVHFNGSILWGVVGPQRFFGPDALYRNLIWFFLLGAVAPPAVWLVARNRKDGILRKVNFPLLFGSISWIPPATGLNFSVWAVMCYLFNYRMRRIAGAWWAKYTMTMSAALDSGLAFGVVVAFFCFLYPGVMDDFQWWGTEIYKRGCDWKACPLLMVGEGEHFG